MGCTNGSYEEPNSAKLMDFTKIWDWKSKYKYICMLGNGAFGKVRLYEDIRIKGSMFAIKTIKKEGISKPYYECWKAEISILRELDHPNIVKYYETWEDEWYIHIVMEYLQGDNLFKVISLKNYNQISEADMSEIIYQLVKSLIFIHNKNIVHRDIKPDNIWFSKKDDYSTLKLIDFGWATNKKDKNSCGTPYYMAPEIINGKMSPKSDWWSVGIVVHFMLTAKFPFYAETKNEIWDNILYQQLDTGYWEKSKCSKEAVDLVMKLLKKDPNERPKTEEWINHPWILKCRNLSVNPEIPWLSENTIKHLEEFSKKTTLEKEILFFIAKISQEDEIKKMKDLFNELDKDDSGTITIQEIKDVYKQIGKEIKDNELKEVWKGLDFHNDGEVNYTEFLASMISNYKFTTEEKLWSVFNYFKDNRDKDYITAESLWKNANELGWVVDEVAIKKEFLKWKNKNKKLDFEEFKNIITIDDSLFRTS